MAYLYDLQSVIVKGNYYALLIIFGLQFARSFVPFSIVIFIMIWSDDYDLAFAKLYLFLLFKIQILIKYKVHYQF